MNSIIYFIGSFLAVLVASISCHANYYIINDPVTSYIHYPFYFVYEKNKDFLLMDITVKVKPSVTAVYVIYQSGTIPLKTKVFTDTKTAEAKTFISKGLMNNFTFIDVELHNQTAVCTTTRVAKGFDKRQLGNWNYKKYDKTNKLYYYTYNKVRYYETSNCLAPYPCGIFVNLTNQDCEATNASDNSNIPKTSTARDITNDSGVSETRGVNKPNASTTRINILTENASNEHETDEHYNATNTTSYVLIVLPILAIVIFVAIILFAIKKCSRKKRNRPQIPRPLPQIPRPQLQNEPDLHTPFYVNMLFRRECEKEIQAQEEPEYEEVVYH